MVIAVAPPGGLLPSHWEGCLVAALVAGLHDRLAANPRLVAAAEAHGCQLVDVREPPPLLQSEDWPDAMVCQSGRLLPPSRGLWG